MSDVFKALSVPKTKSDTQRLFISLAIIIACTVLVSTDKLGVESFVVMIGGVSVYWLGVKSETKQVED